MTITDLTVPTGPMPASDELWDVVVIGAGPAGCAAAITARRQGMHVLLVERTKLPRYKVCGCCLSPQSLAWVRSFGIPVDAAGAPLRTASIRGWGQRVELELGDQIAASRAWLDARLALRAVAVGVSTLHPVSARLGENTSDWRSVLLRSAHGSAWVRARLVIAADGLGGGTQGGQPGRKPSHVGVGATFAADTEGFERGVVHMAVGAAGYAGVVRLEDGTVNVAASLRHAALSRSDLSTVTGRLLVDVGMPRLPDAGTWRGTRGLRFRPRPATRRRIIAAGDAAGFWEPFTGEGIGWALAAGVRAGAVAAELSARWSEQRAKDWTREQGRWISRRQRRSRAVGLLAQWPWMGALSLRALRARPQLARFVMPRTNAMVSAR